MGGGGRATRAGGSSGEPDDDVELAPLPPEASGAVVLLERGADGRVYKVGAGELMPSTMKFHNKVVAPACRALVVTAVEGDAAHRLALPFKDMDCADAATLPDWWAKGADARGGWLLAWPVEFIASPAGWEALQAGAAVKAKRPRDEEGMGGQAPHK